MVLGGEAFQRGLGCEGWALMNYALIKETPESLLTPSSRWKCSKNSTLCYLERNLTRTQPADTLNLNLTVSGTVRNKLLLPISWYFVTATWTKTEKWPRNGGAAVTNTYKCGNGFGSGNRIRRVSMCMLKKKAYIAMNRTF